MKNTVKKFFCGSLLFFFFVANSFGNGISLNSVGARAFGMGGAFIAYSIDGSAIYWNPAGLSFQKSSVYLYGTDIIPMASYKFTAMGIDAKTKTNHYLTPGVFANYNLGNISLGLGVYVPAGLGAEWDGSDLKVFSGGNSLEWESKIGVISISPTISVKATEQLSFGMAVNIYYAMFDLSKPAGPVQFTETSDGLGFGFTFGSLFKISDDISLGATFKTKAEVTMKGDATSTVFFPGPTKSEFERKVAWPMWVGGGVAVRPMDNLVLTLDAQWSQWSKSEDVLTAKYTDPIWNTAMTTSGGDKMTLHWKDCMQIRFGAEYWVSPDFAVRVGYYYDPAPAPDETVNILFPSSTNHVPTFGFTYKSDKFHIDVAGEYLIGGKRTITPTLHNMPGEHQLNTLAFSIGVGYQLD
ncbi:MAG: outer membrane protein transport protein [Ignavibacteriales bacterium]|nr:outer membrane protein transport protein [Ignavibacteriales bacterium]